VLIFLQEDSAQAEEERKRRARERQREIMAKFSAQQSAFSSSLLAMGYANYLV